MTYETAAMRNARYELQILSATEPLARANMLQYIDAYSRLFAGRPGPEACECEPLVGGGFTLEDGEDQILGALVRRDGIERLFIVFDIDDGQGAPVELNLFRSQNGKIFRYRQCVLWAPPSEGRALLVPMGEGRQHGYFAFRRDQPMRWHDGPVPGDLDAGLRRAEQRIGRLLRSAAARKVHLQGFGSVISNTGRRMSVRQLPLAA